MKHYLTQILYLLASLLLIYGAILGVTLLLVPQVDISHGVDAADAENTLYMTDAKYVFLARTNLDTTADKAIIVGASNAMIGFRQKELQRLVPNLVIDNFGLGATNIVETRQIIDLIEAEQSSEALKHNIFVIGTWYGLFVNYNPFWHTPDRVNGDTNIDVERYRYGFYRRTDHGPEAVLPPKDLALGITLIHPYLVLNRLCHDATGWLREKLFARAPQLTDDERNATVVDKEAGIQKLIDWQGSIHQTSISDAPIKLLKDTIDMIIAQGGRVVIAELPLPKWHADTVSLDASLKQKMRQLKADYKNQPKVVFLDMQDMSNSDDFYDEVHPKPRAQPHWSARLAPVLNAMSTSKKD